MKIEIPANTARTLEGMFKREADLTTQINHLTESLQYTIQCRATLVNTIFELKNVNLDDIDPRSTLQVEGNNLCVENKLKKPGIDYPADNPGVHNDETLNDLKQ